MAGVTEARHRAWQFDAVDVESDQASARQEVGKDRVGMTTAAERRIDHDMARPGLQAAQYLADHDRAVQRGGLGAHQRPGAQRRRAGPQSREALATIDGVASRRRERGVALRRSALHAAILPEPKARLAMLPCPSLADHIWFEFKLMALDSSAARPVIDSLPLLPGVLALLQALWAVAHGLEQTSKRMRRQLGITGPQRLVLRVVGLVPGIAAKDLAAVLHVHPSTLSGVLKRLEAQRMLTRRADQRDRRRVRLQLGPAGIRANAERSGTIEAAAAAALATCGPRDVEATIRVLQRLTHELAMTRGAPSIHSAPPSRH